MACSIERQKQIVEAAKSEYKRLAQLQKQGYEEDLENDIYDIAEAMNNMRAIVYKKPENIVESEVTPIDESFINDLNNNKPKDGKASIQIISGVRTAKGQLVYKVKYPNNEKIYTKIKDTFNQIARDTAVDQLCWQKFDWDDPQPGIELKYSLGDIIKEENHVAAIKNQLLKFLEETKRLLEHYPQLGIDKS